MGFAVLLSTLVAVQAPAPPAVTPDPDPLLLKAQYVRIDPFHSVLSFSVKHFGFTRVRGHFNNWGGYILWDPENVTLSSFTVVVHTGSVDTGLERRDNDLKSDNFFDAEAYPVAVFHSNRIEKTDEGLIVFGNLTIGAVTREVAFPFQLLGTREFGPGFGRLFASGSVTLSREEFELTNARDRVARSLAVVSDEVELEIEIQGSAVDPVALPFNSEEKPSIGETLAEVVAEKGGEDAVKKFYALREDDPEAYNFSREELLKLSHKLRADGRVYDAIEIANLAIEIEAEPAITSHASLALAYLALGDTEMAMKECYRMLEIDEYDPLAMEMIRHINSDSLAGPSDGSQ